MYRIDHFQHIPVISFLLLSNESLSNMDRKWTFMVHLNDHLVDSLVNNLTYIFLGCFFKPEQTSRGKYQTTTGTELLQWVDYWPRYDEK